MMAGDLKRYNEKRDFKRTAEPVGKLAGRGGELRYAVQHHMASREHYDLRLEWGGALLSWAVPKGPSYNSGDKRLAVRVEDHPLDYRNFEGTIPKGEYGGGTVMLWDEGSWQPEGDPEKGLREGSLKFTLHGERLVGRWALVRMGDKGAAGKENWLLIKERDEHAGATAGISKYSKSVRSGRTMAQIARGRAAGAKAGAKNPFSVAKVQLARLVKDVPTQGEWLYEVKYDGYRILAFVEGGRARLISRNGKDYTAKFPPVAEALADLAGGRAMVADGEMIVTDAAGRSDFQALQQYIKSPGGKQLCYMLFDLLALDGEDLRHKPLKERKQRLEQLLKGAPDSLRYSAHVAGDGEAGLRAACAANLEGIIGKLADSEYSGTRSGDWVKLKCDNRQEFVIGGYTLSQKRGSGISSLLLGTYDERGLVYAGRASGMSEAMMAELLGKFKKRVRKTPPFENPPTARSGESVTWLTPKYGAEVRFAEWTDEGLLRQASFKGLREDKEMREIVRETGEKERRTAGRAGSKKAGADNAADKAESINTAVKKAPAKKAAPGTGGKKGGGATAGLTSPDKVVFEQPRTTKLDVALYYESIAPRMLPYLDRRLLSTIRCPGGLAAACFYKKHPGEVAEGLVSVPVINSKGESDEYFYVKNLAGLMHEVQMNTLEFHTWGSRADRLERPDIMVFDLDPDEGMELAQVRQGVRDLKGVLDELSLKSFLKTSGGKGYHVVVPLRPAADWDVFRGFAKNVALAMEQRWPERYTSNMRKERRRGKIFIDWVRNTRGATSVAPYSLRARGGGPVSMPITWAELGKVAPDGVNMAGAVKRLRRKDPWEGFFEVRQGLK